MTPCVNSCFKSTPDKTYNNNWILQPTLVPRSGILLMVSTMTPYLLITSASWIPLSKPCPVTDLRWMSLLSMNFGKPNSIKIKVCNINTYLLKSSTKGFTNSSIRKLNYSAYNRLNRFWMNVSHIYWRRIKSICPGGISRRLSKDISETYSSTYWMNKDVVKRWWVEEDLALSKKDTHWNYKIMMDMKMFWVPFQEKKLWEVELQVIWT